MEFIASLRQQLDRLCAEPSVDPNWMLRQLSHGLRERYGRVAVGFVRRRQHDSSQVQLLGLADIEGEVVVPLSDDFRPDRRHPSTLAGDVATEAWIDLDRFGGWDHEAADTAMARVRGAFLTPWLVDRPADWHILVLSPIAAPNQLRQDRGLSVTSNLLATNLLRALDAQRLDRANAWIDRELDEIAQLQRLLQPEPPIRLGGVDVAFAADIYQYAGGDYIDIPRLTHLLPESERHREHDHWGAIVADVSGHGPSAAVEAAMVDAIFRTYRRTPGDGPADVLAYLNDNLFTRRPRAAYVSAFLCSYWPRERLLRFANAGHPPPILRPAGGAPRLLDEARGIPLRVLREQRWPGGERRVAPGDLLVVYTDGVTESRSPGGDALGMDGLLQMVATLEGSSQAMLDALRTALDEFRGDIPPRDDQTLLAIQWVA